MIGRQYRLLIQMKELEQKGVHEKQISAELHTHPYVTGKLLRQARNYSFTALESALEQILVCDIALKTGAAPRFTLEQLLISLVNN